MKRVKKWSPVLVTVLFQEKNNYQVNKLLGEQRGQKVPQFALFDLSKEKLFRLPIDP
jgi:hypothetical protein